MYPILMEILGYPLESYFVLWSMALTMWVFYFRNRAVNLYGFSINDAANLAALALVGSYIGARIGAYFDYWDYFANHPAEILAIWKGGLASGPGLLGAAIAGAWYAHRKRQSIIVWGEALAPTLPLMESVGRIGCFLNGCCFGEETSLWMGLKFPGIHGLRHPTQLYYSLLDLILWLWLIWWEKRNPNIETRNPRLLPVYLVAYGCMRLFVDSLRDGAIFFGFRISQWMGLLMVLLGIYFFARAAIERKNHLIRNGCA